MRHGSVTRMFLGVGLVLCTMGNISCGVMGIAVGTVRNSIPANTKFQQGDPKTSKSPIVSPLLDPWRDYDILRESKLSPDIIEPFFAKRPGVIAQRLWKVSSTLFRARREWHRSAAISTDEERASNLCQALASLGPVAVKVGQTLSQRPDIVGLDAAKALARLQTKNVAFRNELAYAVLQESLQCQWIAPGVGTEIVGERPLFATMSLDPVACASLGQVYKATTWEGLEVAVKVQRPDAMQILALDTQCFRQVFATRTQFLKLKQNLLPEREVMEEASDKQNVGTVIDRVARDIMDELDYDIEAANSIEFKESLAFLGFVTTPNTLPQYSSKRVLVTEWIPGHHLENLNVTAGLSMTRMAVEACTASMVLTGLVHADPHEGNIMLHEDGRVAFLDFGLMSRVDQNIMEGFARGIQALLSEDWVSLTDAFVDVGFVTEPIMYRDGRDKGWRADPNYGRPQLAEALASAMENTEGGKARFGALAIVLNKKISPNWLVFTPPYVLLLIRTFLTLEGIAARLDPDFNIYEMAMPWAVRRSLSPSTAKGIEVFRSAFMTPDNRIQWARLLELASPGKEEANDSLPTPEASTKKEKKTMQDTAKKAAMNDAIGSLLGSTEGRVLRRALRDLDSGDLLTKLSSDDGRTLLQKAATAAASRVLTTNRRGSAIDSLAESHRPISEECAQLRYRQARWKRKVGRLLFWSHMKRQFGWKGLVSITRLSLICTKLFAIALWNRIRGQVVKSVPAPAME